MQVNNSQISNNETNFWTKYFGFMKKTLKFWYLSIIIASVIEIVFMMIIIFHHSVTGQLSIVQYLMFAYNIIIASLLLYPSYIYSNKAYIADITLIAFQLLFLAFIIPTTLYYWADITQERINNVTTKITIYLTKKEYIYTSVSLWFDFIFTGCSIVSSIVAYYFSSKISSKPWKIRIESEKVISRPKN